MASFTSTDDFLRVLYRVYLKDIFVSNTKNNSEQIGPQRESTAGVQNMDLHLAVKTVTFRELP